MTTRLMVQFLIAPPLERAPDRTIISSMSKLTQWAATTTHSGWSTAAAQRISPAEVVRAACNELPRSLRWHAEFFCSMHSSYLPWVAIYEGIVGDCRIHTLRAWVGTQLAGIDSGLATLGGICNKALCDVVGLITWTTHCLLANPVINLDSNNLPN